MEGVTCHDFGEGIEQFIQVKVEVQATGLLPTAIEYRGADMQQGDSGLGSVQRLWGLFEQVGALDLYPHASLGVLHLQVDITAIVLYDLLQR